MDKNTKICVIYGGMSVEREVSLKSGKNMADALLKNFPNTHLVDADFSLAEKLCQIKPDICVVALHGTYGEDGCIQGMLEMMGIPYTGSGVAASAVAFDKLLAKQNFIDYKLPTPKYVIVNEGDKKAPFIPCVVKAARQGSSIGVTIVHDEKDYEAAVKEAFKYDSKVICEEFIEGKELTIPVMDGKAFPPIWIRPKKGFYNYENKYTAGMTEYLLDTGLSAARIRNLKKLAVKVYNTLGCRSMARIDFIATDRKFYVIEVNTVPGMTATSLVPKSASKLGISFEEIVKKIAESASLDNKK